MTRTKSTYLAVLAVLLSPMAANADPITWTISDSTLGCALGISGQFDYDADAGEYSAFEVDGDCGEDYDPINGASITLADTNSMQLSLLGYIYPDSLLIVFDSALTNAGGTIGGTWYELLNQAGVSESNYDYSGDLTVSAVGVPEPGTLALFGIGLLGMAAARRRRKV